MNELIDPELGLNLARKFYNSYDFRGHSLPWFLYDHKQRDKGEHAYRWSNMARRWV